MLYSKLQLSSHNCFMLLSRPHSPCAHNPQTPFLEATSHPQPLPSQALHSHSSVCVAPIFSLKPLTSPFLLLLSTDQCAPTVRAASLNMTLIFHKHLPLQGDLSLLSQSYFPATLSPVLPPDTRFTVQRAPVSSIQNSFTLHRKGSFCDPSHSGMNSNLPHQSRESPRGKPSFPAQSLPVMSTHTPHSQQLYTLTVNLSPPTPQSSHTKR